MPPWLNSVWIGALPGIAQHLEYGNIYTVRPDADQS